VKSDEQRQKLDFKNLEPRTSSHFRKRIAIAGMNDFHAVAARDNARVVCF